MSAPDSDKQGQRDAQSGARYRGTPKRIFAIVGIAWMIWLCIGLAWVGLAGGVTVGNEATLAKGGQFGDWFGGLNALFTALALGVVVWTNQLQRHEAREQERLFLLQQKEIKRQSFEASLFQMIALCRELHGGLQDKSIYLGETIVRKVGQEFGTEDLATGADAMQRYANRCKKILESMASSETTATLSGLEQRIAIGMAYEVGPYSSHSRYLGPYFRALYHLFKLIERQSFLDELERRQYANLARAHLSDDDLVVLAANLCSKSGAGMLPIAEKYGLLKHLPESPVQLTLLRKALPAGCFEGDPRLD